MHPQHFFQHLISKLSRLPKGTEYFLPETLQRQTGAKFNLKEREHKH